MVKNYVAEWSDSEIVQNERSRVLRLYIVCGLESRSNQLLLNSILNVSTHRASSISLVKKKLDNKFARFMERPWTSRTIN